MISIDWSLGVSAFVFLVTVVALDRILFQPLLRVLDERREKTTDQLEMATREQRRYLELVEELERRIRAEKKAGYRRAEAIRQQQLRERQGTLERARREAEKLMAAARAQLEKDLESARRRLAGEAPKMASLITDRVLGVGR